MTREGYNKHKEVFEAWLDGKQIQILGENGQWIDSLADIKWKEHKEYRVKPTRIEFEDCSFNETEYKVDKIGKIVEVRVDRLKINNNRIKSTLFKDKEIAEAYAVLPQLIRLRDEYNGRWKPDYEDEVDKYSIGCYKHKLGLFDNQYTQRILIFETVEIRDKFFNDHRDLLEIAKPLL